MPKTPKDDAMAIANQLRKVEREVSKLHGMMHRSAFRHADLIGLNESEGDFTALSGGTPKLPPREGDD